MVKTFAALALATLAGLASAWPAAAQLDERTSPHLRNDCRLATQILTEGQPDPRRAWALRTIPSCNESGGAVIAALWAAPPAADELERLYWSTAEFLDERVLLTVRAAAANTANATAVRLAALRVLAAYVEPHLDPTAADLTPPREGEFAQPIRSVDHRVQTPGAQPLPADHDASILSLLSLLAASDPDATVRYAARRLHRALTPG